MITKTRPLIAALLTLASLGAQAAQAAGHSSYELRAWLLETDTGNPFSSYNGIDRLADGNPLTGAVYQPWQGTVAKAGGTVPSTFSPGAERIGAAGDLVGHQYGLGGLAFRYGDATLTTSALTPPPYQQYGLTLQAATVPGTGLGFAPKAAGFHYSSFWDFALPEPGSSLLTTLAGTSSGTGSTGTSNFSDRLQLRLYSDYQTGQTFVAFEQLARTDGVLSRTTLESHALADVYGDLAAVDYMEFELLRALPTAADTNPVVQARVVLYDAALTGGDLVELRRLDFATTATTFVNGTGSSVFTSAQWLDPLPVVSVPEPPATALWLAGMLAVALRKRRD